MNEKVRVKLEVVVRDKSGKVLKRICKNKDMLTAIFRKIFLFGLMGHNNDSNVEVSYSLQDETNTAYTVYLWGALARKTFITGGLGAARRKIAIGEGTTEPTRADYRLESKAYESSTAAVVEAADYVMYAATVLCPEAKNISEAGYFNQYWSTTDSAFHWFLLFRDTFTPIEVPAEGTVSITYTVEI